MLFADLPGLAGWYQYFLDVPIEIKREALEGELASWSRLALPALAALGLVTAETKREPACGLAPHDLG